MIEPESQEGEVVLPDLEVLWLASLSAVSPSLSYAWLVKLLKARAKAIAVAQNAKQFMCLIVRKCVTLNDPEMERRWLSV